MELVQIVVAHLELLKTEFLIITMMRSLHSFQIGKKHITASHSIPNLLEDKECGWVPSYRLQVPEEFYITTKQKSKAEFPDWVAVICKKAHSTFFFSTVLWISCPVFYVHLNESVRNVESFSASFLYQGNNSKPCQYNCTW